MRALFGTEFAALLVRATSAKPTSPASRLHRPSGQQLVPGPRPRAALDAALAVNLQDASPEAIQILLEEVQFSWHETLGVRPTPTPAQFAAPGPDSPSPYHPAVLRNRWAASNAAYERAGLP